MQLKAIIGPATLLLFVISLSMALPWYEIAAWATTQQRSFQNIMATSLQTIKAGDAAATWSLCLATAAYGFVHALGPGHGKVLLGGAAIASGATFRRMLTLSLAASLAQAICAILIVTVLLQSIQIASRDAVELTEKWLAPISYLAIATIGAVLIVRGIRGLVALLSVNNRQSQHHGCNHNHGVSLSDVKSLQSNRDVAVLIGSIAIRPCTGALFLLVIAARLDIFSIGVLATLTMGMGTAMFNILAAGSGVAAHRLSTVGNALDTPAAQSLSASLHIAGGFFILASSLLLLLSAIG